MYFSRYGTVRLAVVAAAIEMFVGLAIYAFPREFSASVYDPIRSLFPLLSPALVAGGVLLLIQTRYPLQGWVRRTISPLSAAPLAMLAVYLILPGAWSGTAFYGLLAAALLVSPWLPAEKHESPGDSLDLFMVVAGLIQASVGSLMLIQPQAFATPNYDGISPIILKAGMIGVSAAVIMLVHRSLRREPPVLWLLRLVGAALPLLMTYNFAVTRAWTGVLAWGTISLAILMWDFPRQGFRPNQNRFAEPGGDEPDPLPLLERTIEVWTWLLALSVVALAGLGGTGAFSSPTSANLFVLAISGYNAVVHWSLPRLGTPAQRIYAHLAILTVILGFLLSDPGPMGSVGLALLVVAPTLAARALGPAVGRQLLAIGIAVVILSDLAQGMLAALPATLVMGPMAIRTLVLAGAAAVGIRSAGDQRRLLLTLASARTDLQQQVQQLALLDRIGGAIRRTLDLEQILRTTEQQLGLALGVSRCFIQLARGDKARLVTGRYCVPGESSAGNDHHACQAMLQFAAGVREEVCVADVATDSQFRDCWTEGCPRAVLVMPIEAEGRLLGVICLQDRSPREWTKHETDFARAVAGQVGVAIFQAYTHSALAERHEDLQQAHEELQAQSEELLAHQEGLKRALTSISLTEAAHARLVAILEATPDFVSTSDPKGSLLSINSAGRSMLGLGRQEQITGIQIRNAHPEWANSIVLNEGIPTAVREGVWRGETALLSRDGREIPVSQVILAHWGADGSLGYLSTIARDITAQKQAEEALRRSEERFRMAFGHAPIGMALVGTDGLLVQVNQALCQMLGHSEQELLGMRCDDLTHPVDRPQFTEAMGQLLDGSISSCQMDCRFLHRDGHVTWGRLNISLMGDGVGAPVHFIAQIQDISEQKRFQEQLVRLASHDPLTDLLNRRQFQVELEQQLALAGADGCGFAVLFLDLDEFKDVNDTLGHAAGDELLCSLSTMLKGDIREATILARLGGDEFGFLLPLYSQAEAERVARIILAMIRNHTVVVGGQPIGITGSIGIAMFPDHGSTAEELLAHADVALYQAKAMGRNLCHTYVPDSLRMAQAGERLTWEQRIREALNGDGFMLECQPIQNLQTGQTSQYEVLLRMVDDTGEIIAPSEFLGVAERFGLIHAIDRWVVRRAIHLLAGHSRAGRHITLAVNLSGRAFADTELLSLIQQELAATGVDPGDLVLEITETAAVTDLKQAIKFLTTLKRMGCRFAIDDFGTGFSSLSHLKHLPVDFLKLDGSFVVNLVNDPVDRHLVKAIVTVARGLGMETIAEFAGNEETMALLREIGVDQAQGLHIGRPRPVTEMWPDLADMGKESESQG